MTEITQNEYRKTVKTLAQEALEISQESDIDLSEAIWELVDSHSWVIYYSNNLGVLENSQMGPGEFHHLIDDSMSYRKVIQVLAYSALENDVWDMCQELQD